MRRIAASLVRVILITAVVTATAAAAQEGAVDFTSPRWEIAAGRIVDVLGRKAFMGAAALKDAEFGNGVIEFDVAATTDRARSYPGVTFRSRPGGNWERIYIRPHRSALYNDVVQYVAAFNGVDSWQLYNGPGATAMAVIPVNQWLHVKIEVAGDQARVFLGGQETPVLVVPHLKHGASRGGVGVMGPADGSAYFSNFSYRADETLSFPTAAHVDAVPGVIRNWRISKPFPALGVDLEKTPEAQKLGDPAWKDLEAEPGGLVDISRLYPRSGRPDLVFARAVIQSAGEETRKFDLGYSDIVTVFLNGRPVFQGNSQYQGRDQSFLGVVGWFDSVFLPLRKGANELTLAVAEVSGGWGFMVRGGQAVYAVEGAKKLWETPKTFLSPESVAFDPVRNCLYVSNFEPANPSGAEGKQAIARMTLDGAIEDPAWVKGVANPSGLVVVGDKLYAVERKAIAEIDILQAKVVGRFPIPGAGLPNDIAVGPDGALYVSDSNRAAIFKCQAGKVELWLQDARIARPNGLAFDDQDLIVGANADGCLKAVSLATKEIRTIADLGVGVIDGIACLGSGTYLVSHNEGRLFRVTTDGQVVKLIDQTVVGQNIADFAYLPSRRLIVFPTWTDNRVAAYSLSLPTVSGGR